MQSIKALIGREKLTAIASAGFDKFGHAIFGTAREVSGLFTLAEGAEIKDKSVAHRYDATFYSGEKLELCDLVWRGTLSDYTAAGGQVTEMYEVVEVQTLSDGKGLEKVYEHRLRKLRR